MSKNYRIPNDVRHSFAAADGSTVELEFSAGDLAPTSALEETAVAQLFTAGLAFEQVEKPTKKKADAPAEVVSEE